MINLFGYDFSITELVTMSLSFLLTVFYAFKTGGIKKLIKEVNETMIKFRSQQTVEPTVGQSISPTKPEYRLNKATDTLEMLESSVDIQAIIDSCRDQVLSAVLERFLPIASERDNLVADYSVIKDDLDELGSVISRAEEYREVFDLPKDTSLTDIYKYVSNKAVDLKNQIENFGKEVVRNEEALKSEGESKELQKGSEEGQK